MMEEQIMENSKEQTEPKSKPKRSQKQIEWSRKLGQNSRELKKQKLERESMPETAETKNETAETKTKHEKYLVIPVVAVFVYFIYRKFYHTETQEKEEVEPKESDSLPTKYLLNMN